jgi:hypothetical protein
MYTPDDRYIVTGALDGSIRIWTHVFKEVSIQQTTCCNDFPCYTLMSMFVYLSCMQHRAIPEMHAYCRFNDIPMEKCPRPRWKFGAVTCMDVSLDGVRVASADGAPSRCIACIRMLLVPLCT